MKNIKTIQVKIIIVLILCIFFLKKYTDYREYQSQSDLYKKSFRQIQYYKANKNQMIFITAEMCEYEDEKGLHCRWDLKNPYYYMQSEYDKLTDQWYIFLHNNLQKDSLRISTESVRIIYKPKKIFTKDSWLYIDVKRAQELHPRAQFIEHRPYYFLSIDENEILVLDNGGNQVFLPSDIRIPTPPLVE